MDTSFRPMTKRERAELEELVSPATAFWRVFLFLFALTVVGLMAASLQNFVELLLDRRFGLPLWALVTLLFGIWLYLRAGRWTGGSELRDRIRRDLERGELARRRVVVVEAVEAPEVEDEGPVFFVREEDGQVLFFAGQHLSREKGKGFPWRAFDIVEAPQSGHFFRLKRRGDPFPDVRTREPLEYAEARELGVLERVWGAIDVDLDDLT